MGADMNKINQLLEHLNISQVFIAGQIPTDMINFCEENPEKVSGIGLIGTTEIDSSPFKSHGHRTIIISSNKGITHSAASNLKSDIPEVRNLELKDYEILPWTDIALDRASELVEGLTTFFYGLNCNETTTHKATSEGKIDDIYYTIKGVGPPLVLLPFMLSAAQWDPVIEELSKSFTVIVASGPSLGFIPTLEGRASLPTYKSMFSTLLSFMEVPNHGKLLELGCGTGALCRQAMKLRPDLAVTGADINKYLLNGAYQLAEIEDIKVNTYFNCPNISKDEYAGPGEFNITFSDATKIPFPDNFFDAVYSVTVLEECDANQALKEIYRVVKPGGSIGVVVRAIDMPQWLDLSVDDELWRKIIIPPQLISPSGVADKSLYSRVANANFKNLVMFPYLFSATRKADPKIYDWYLRRVYQPLMDMEKAELDAAKNQASEEDGLIYSQPLHCCVGWK